MKRVVVYHPKVPGEVREIYEDYSEISEELGEDFWNRLIAAIDYAAEFPERHHIDLPSRPHHLLRRSLPAQSFPGILRQNQIATNRDDSAQIFFCTPSNPGVASSLILGLDYPISYQ